MTTQFLSVIRNGNFFPTKKYAYQKKYNAKNITMLYPITEQISQKIEHEKEIQFTSDDDVIVRVRFVDLFDIKKSLLGLIDL